MFTFFVAVMMLAIIISLVVGLKALVKPNPDDPSALVRALSWRVGLSAGLLIALLALAVTGVVGPHGFFG